MEHILGPLMFIVLFLLIFSGYPVAFSLAGTSLIFAVIGIAIGDMDWHLFLALPERIFGIMANYVLLAIPFFIFMGTMLEKSRLAEDLLTTIGQLFGSVRGGLAFAVLLVGTLLAAATGVVGASVVAMGMISLPVMLKHGYSKELSTGIITASGTLGQIIPPSIVLVILADQMGVSVGDLFLAALVPGLMLAGFYAILVTGLVIVKPAAAPALHESHRNLSGSQLFKKVLFVLMPPLTLILFVLGSIFAGIATPTEAGALGAIGAIILAALNRRLNRESLESTLTETGKLTAMIMFLLIGSTAFGLVFRGIYGDFWIQDLLTGLPGGKIGLILLSGLVIFILGFFIDFFEIVFIIVPLLVPAAYSLGIDLVWFAIIIAMNLQTSFLTPPFGFSIFYLKGVAPPEVKTTDIYRGVLPFIAVQIFTVAMVYFFPEILQSAG